MNFQVQGEEFPGAGGAGAQELSAGAVRLHGQAVSGAQQAGRHGDFHGEISGLDGRQTPSGGQAVVLWQHHQIRL